MAVRCWTIAMDEVHVLGTYDRACATVFWTDWRRWATEIKTGIHRFRPTETQRWWKVPFLARGKTEATTLPFLVIHRSPTEFSPVGQASRDTVQRVVTHEPSYFRMISAAIE